MVNTIQFNATRFNTKDDNNLLELTDNKTTQLSFVPTSTL